MPKLKFVLQSSSKEIVLARGMSSQGKNENLVFNNEPNSSSARQRFFVGRNDYHHDLSGHEQNIFLRLESLPACGQIMREKHCAGSPVSNVQHGAREMTGTNIR
jgi:hypothetical protein